MFLFAKEPAHTKKPCLLNLALKFDCDIIPVYLERKKDNFLKMEILNPIEINKNKQNEEDKKTITIKINQIIEKMIIRNQNNGFGLMVGGNNYFLIFICSNLILASVGE